MKAKRRQVCLISRSFVPPVPDAVPVRQVTVSSTEDVRLPARGHRVVQLSLPELTRRFYPEGGTFLLHQDPGLWRWGVYTHSVVVHPRDRVFEVLVGNTKSIAITVPSFTPLLSGGHVTLHGEDQKGKEEEAASACAVEVLDGVGDSDSAYVGISTPTTMGDSGMDEDDLFDKYPSVLDTEMWWETEVETAPDDESETLAEDDVPFPVTAAVAQGAQRTSGPAGKDVSKRGQDVKNDETNVKSLQSQVFRLRLPGSEVQPAGEPMVGVTVDGTTESSGSSSRWSSGRTKSSAANIKWDPDDRTPGRAVCYARRS